MKFTVLRSWQMSLQEIPLVTTPPPRLHCPLPELTSQTTGCHMTQQAPLLQLTMVFHGNQLHLSPPPPSVAKSKIQPAMVTPCAKFHAPP